MPVKILRMILVLALLALVLSICWGPTELSVSAQREELPAPSGNGDVNCDGARDISDAVYLLNWLFLGSSEPCAFAQDREDFSTPLDFGAVGDGVTDDTVALQEALDTGKTVRLLSGRYRITHRLDVPGRGGLAGPGAIVHDFDVQLPPEPPSQADAALFISGDDVVLSGFRIEKTFVDGSYGHGILAQNVQRLKISEIDIRGYSARYGIHIIESADFEVRGCHIHDFDINTESDMIQDSPAGLRITRCQRGVISGNRIVDIRVGEAGRASLSPLRPEYGPQGYQSDCMTVSSSRDMTITGNVCTTSGEGIDLLLSSSCVVSNNVIRDIWFQGIKMLGVSFSTVSGNQIADCYQGIGLAYHPGLDAPPVAKNLGPRETR